MNILELKDYVIEAPDGYMGQIVAQALKEALGICLPVVTHQEKTAAPRIFVGVQPFQNYGGYRYGIAVEKNGIFVGGGTEALYAAAGAMLSVLLQQETLHSGWQYGYLWQNEELQHRLLLKENREDTLCEGVTWLHRQYQRETGEPVQAYIIIAQKNAPVRAAVWGSPQGQSQTVPEHVAQMVSLGKDVTAVVNADFFHFFNNGDKTTYGIQIIDGTVYKEPSNTERYGDHWFGVTKDGEYVMSDLEGYFDTYKGHLQQAVGGGVWLMQEQRVCIPSSSAVDPRTAVAITTGGDLVLLCVDGRSEESVGVTYADLLRIFMDLDVELRTVLNLDGGHSTIMMVKGRNGEMEIVNQPSSGLEALRPIADVLALVRV